MSPRDHDHTERGEIKTNDSRDGIIARLLERSEWMMDEAERTRNLTDRMDQTLEHFGTAITKLDTAVENLSNAYKPAIDDLRAKMSGVESELLQVKAKLASHDDVVKFWGTVRDRIAWIAMALIFAAVIGGYGINKAAEHIHF